MNSRGTSTVSVSRGDPRRVACADNSLRTSAKASEKVGRGLRYHAARRTVPMLRAIRRWAKGSRARTGQQRRCGLSDRPLRPLPLRLYPEMPPPFLKDRLHVPTRDKPPKDLFGPGTKQDRCRAVLGCQKPLAGRAPEPRAWERLAILCYTKPRTSFKTRVRTAPSS